MLPDKLVAVSEIPPMKSHKMHSIYDTYYPQAQHITEQ